MEVKERFDDLTDICHTCGALVVERERHNERHNDWHNLLEELVGRFGAALFGSNKPEAPETPTENTLSAPTAPAVVPNAGEPSPATPRSET